MSKGLDKGFLMLPSACLGGKRVSEPIMPSHHDIRPNDGQRPIADVVSEGGASGHLSSNLDPESLSGLLEPAALVPRRPNLVPQLIGGSKDARAFPPGI